MTYLFGVLNQEPWTPVLTYRFSSSTFRLTSLTSGVTQFSTKADLEQVRLFQISTQTSTPCYYMAVYVLLLFFWSQKQTCSVAVVVLFSFLARPVSSRLYFVRPRFLTTNGLVKVSASFTALENK